MHPQKAKHRISEDLKPGSIKPSTTFGSRGIRGTGRLTWLPAARHRRTSGSAQECALVCPPHSSLRTHSLFHLQSYIKNIFEKLC